MNDSKLAAYQSKRELVADMIREAISRGEIVPGQRLQQEDLARKLGVSSTPIREALRLLEAEGIIEHEPNKGVRVTVISTGDAKELYLIRSILEGQAAKMAVDNLSPADLKKLEKMQLQMEEWLAAGKLKLLRKLNDDFHWVIYKAVNIRRLQQMITNLWTQYPGDALWGMPESAELFVKEHREILSALQAKDQELVGKLVSEHIETAGKLVIQFIEQKATLPQ